MLLLDCWVGETVHAELILSPLKVPSLQDFSECAINSNGEWTICLCVVCTLHDHKYYLVFLLNQWTPRDSMVRACGDWKWAQSLEENRQSSGEIGCDRLNRDSTVSFSQLKKLTINAPVRHVGFTLHYSFASWVWLWQGTQKSLHLSLSLPPDLGCCHTCLVYLSWLKLWIFCPLDVVR